MNALIKWILPGLVTVAVLTAVANWLEGDAIEAGIGKKIEKALGRDHPWAELAMERRDVTVSGLAPSAEVSRDAFARIASVTGIREVVDNSGLLPVASPYRFLAERNEAGLSLSGNAPDIQTRDAILKLAKKAAGGAKIEDAIELAAGAPSGFVEAVEGAMKILPSLRNPTFSLEDSTLNFSGETPTLRVFERLSKTFEELPAGFQVVREALLPPPASPYRWSIAKRASGVTVRGNIPSEDARTQLLADIKSRFAVDTVTDRMELASGEPAGANAMRDVLMRYVGMLSAGEANMVDKAVSIAGRAPDAATRQAIDQGLAAELAEGFSGLANVIAPKSEEATSEIPLAEPFQWAIRKNENGVLLSGNVSSKEEAASVLEFAKQNFAGLEVTDNQVPARGASSAIGQLRDLLMSQLRLMDSGSASVSGPDVSFDGKTANPNLAALVSRTLQNRLPEGFVSKGATIGPLTSQTQEEAEPEASLPVADPFRWSISRLPDAITLLGNVTSEEQRNRVLDAVRAFAGESSVVDRQVLARGEPEGFGQVRDLVIGQMANITSGQGNIIGTAVEISGNAVTSELAGKIENALRDSLPASFKPSIRIEPPLTGEQAKCREDILAAIDGRKIRFQTARASLAQGSDAILKDVVEAAVNCPDVRFRIEGHTDSRGRANYNLELSKARAEAVLYQLVASGANADQFEAVGFGEEQPVADNALPEGRTQNRRIIFSVIQ